MKTINDLLNNTDQLRVVCGASTAMIAKIAENAAFDGV